MKFLLMFVVLAQVVPRYRALDISRYRTSPLQYHVQHDIGPDRYFRYETYNGQWRKERRLHDGRVLGSYGWTDPTGVLRLYDYTAGKSGYRIVRERTVQLGEDDVALKTQALKDGAEIKPDTDYANSARGGSVNDLPGLDGRFQTRKAALRSYGINPGSEGQVELRHGQNSGVDARGTETNPSEGSPIVPEISDGELLSPGNSADKELLSGNVAAGRSFVRPGITHGNDPGVRNDLTSRRSWGNGLLNDVRRKSYEKARKFLAAPKSVENGYKNTDESEAVVKENAEGRPDVDIKSPNIYTDQNKVQTDGNRILIGSSTRSLDYNGDSKDDINPYDHLSTDQKTSRSRATEAAGTAADVHPAQDQQATAALTPTGNKGTHSTIHYDTGNMFHFEEILPDGTKLGRHGYVDPFGILRVTQYTSGAGGHLEQRSSRHVGTRRPGDPV